LHFSWQSGTLLRLQADGSSDVPALVHQLNRFPRYWDMALDLYALKR
jgi:hypothetical protein